MELVLISFALCPYLQRATLMLREKGVAHEVRYVDLAKKPDWFRALSPSARVPLLLADGQLVDDATAITELIEELHPSPRLHPKSPLGRAHDRGLSSYAAGEVFPTAYRLQIARTEDQARGAVRDLLEKLAPIERELERGEFLSDDHTSFGLADVALTPFGVRADVMRRAGFVDITAQLPALARWVERVNARPAVQASIPADFSTRVLADMERRDSWLHANPGGLSA